MKNSENIGVQYIINRAHTNTVGQLGKNILYLKMYSVADRDRSVAIESSRIDQIRELIRARDGLDQLSVLNSEEIQDILDYVEYLIQLLFFVCYVMILFTFCYYIV